jgi:chromosomal replication initiator protein
MTVIDIMQSAARHFGIRVTDIIGPARSKALSRARQVTMAVCRDTLELSYPELGRAFGNRDHSTIINGIQNARRQRLQSRVWDDDFRAIEAVAKPIRIAFAEEEAIEWLAM